MSNEIASYQENASSFELIQRRAKAYSESSIVPKEYQKNVPNCIVAIEIAQRLRASEMMVMQNLYIVAGRPGWSSQFIIASINSCGRFKSLRFDISGEGDNYGCVAWSEDKDGNKLTSSRITIGMAKKEGWYQKNGSKWQTMPEQMLKYRSSSFFGKIYAPDILMGMQTVEEIEDVFSGQVDVTPKPSVLSEVIAKAKEAKQAEIAVQEVVIEEIKEEQPSLIVEEPILHVVEDVVYSAALTSIMDAKGANELDQIMLKMDLDSFPLEVQDNLQKASERRFEEFKKEKTK